MASEEFECTQILHESFDIDQTKQPEKLQVACFNINGQTFRIMNGDTKIGRDPKNCMVFINKKSVSAHHALIEVESGHHLICDLGSSNSTRLNGMLLKPHVRYNLTSGSIIQIADLKGIYKIGPAEENDCDTSIQDMFASPVAMPRVIKPATNRDSLKFSDDSIIESTPMKPVFKHPHLTSRFVSPVTNTSIHEQSTLCDLENDIYEAETIVENDGNDSSLFSDSLDPTKQKVISSFIVPCSQQDCSDASLQLHLDESVPLTNEKDVSEDVEDGLYGGDIEQDLNLIEKKIIEEELGRIDSCVSKDTLESNLKEKCNLPITSVVSHGAGNKDSSSTIPTRKEAKNINEDNVSEASPRTSMKGNNAITQDNHVGKMHMAQVQAVQKACTEVSKEKYKSNEDIHDAKTQIVHSNTTDSDTDEEGVYGASTEAPEEKDTNAEDIHDAKTQIVHSNPSDSDTDEEGVYGACTEAPEEKDTNAEDIHDAKTQIVHVNPSDSDTDEEGVYGACTEATEKEEKDAEDIHDAKTQIAHANPSDSDGESVYGACTEKPEEKIINAEDIHDAKTQVVEPNPSDSDTDEEGVYGACTEKPEEEVINAEYIHDAKTQVVEPNPSGSDTDEEGVYGACTEAPEKKEMNAEDIHDAKTQIVHANHPDSNTDEKGVYEACTEKPEEEVINAEDIHDAKTQMVESHPSDSDTDEEGVYGACTKAPEKKEMNAEDIHDAKTQIIHSNASSDTDEEGVYGACTEKPKKKVINSEDIHDAKTQIVQSNTSDSETDEEGVYGACTEVPERKYSKTEAIHDAKTQTVHCSASDSETDEEGVYGACTELPNCKDTNSEDIHDAKTQIAQCNDSNSENNIAGSSTQVSTTKDKICQNIHDTDTLTTQGNVSNSDDVYEACTEVPRNAADGLDNIHDAKTQIIDCNACDSDTDGEGVYGACTEAPEKKDFNAVDIHDAETQIVHSNASGSETDEEGVYGACTEILKNGNTIEPPPKKGSKTKDIRDVKTQVVHGNVSEVRKNGEEFPEDIHDARTQIVHSNASDLDIDEDGVYEACTEAPEKNGENDEDIHDAKTQIVLPNASDSETDEEGVYGACTEKPDNNDMAAEEVHDAKTQIVLDDDSNSENSSGPSTKALKTKDKNLGDIHNAKTQLLHGNDCDSPTDDASAYGACTEIVKNEGECPKVLHDAKTQTASDNASNSETDEEGVYEACTKVSISLNDGEEANHDTKTQVSSNMPEDANVAKIQAAFKNQTISETDKEGIHKAVCAVPNRKEGDAAMVMEMRLSGLETVIRSPTSIKESDSRTQIANTNPCNENKEDKTPTAVIVLPESSVQCMQTRNKKATSPKKKLSLGANKKKDEKNTSTFNRGVIQLSADEDLLSAATNRIDSATEDDIFTAATQLLPSPSTSKATKAKVVKGIESVIEGDIFTAATQVLPSAGTSKESKGKVRDVSEDDFFCAATQIIPENETKILSKEITEDIFDAATQLLTSPLSGKGTEDRDEDVSITAVQVISGPRSNKRNKSENSWNKDKTSAPAEIILRQNPSKIQNSKQTDQDGKVPVASQLLPSSKENSHAPASSRKTTRSRTSNTVAHETPTTLKQRPSDRNLRAESSSSQNQSKMTTRKRKCSQLRGSNQKRRLRSSPLEANIEDTSSDSDKSADHIIDEGSPEPPHTADDDAVSNSSDISEKQLNFVFETPSTPKELSDEKDPEPAILQASPSSTQNRSDIGVKTSKPANLESSPIMSRSTVRRTLSLSKSRRSNISPKESVLATQKSEGHVSTVQAQSNVSQSEQCVTGVRRLHPREAAVEKEITRSSSVDQSELASEAENIRKVLRRSTRNSQNITEAEELNTSSGTRNLVAEDKCESSDVAKSILKHGIESGSSRKRVSFFALEEVPVADLQVKGITKKAEKSTKTSSDGKKQASKKEISSEPSISQPSVEKRNKSLKPPDSAGQSSRPIEESGIMITGNERKLEKKGKRTRTSTVLKQADKTISTEGSSRSVPSKLIQVESLEGTKTTVEVANMHEDVPVADLQVKGITKIAGKSTKTPSVGRKQASKGESASEPSFEKRNKSLEPPDSSGQSSRPIEESGIVYTGNEVKLEIKGKRTRTSTVLKQADKTIKTEGSIQSVPSKRIRVESLEGTETTEEAANMHEDIPIADLQVKSITKKAEKSTKTSSDGKKQASKKEISSEPSISQPSVEKRNKSLKPPDSAGQSSRPIEESGIMITGNEAKLEIKGKRTRTSTVLKQADKTISTEGSSRSVPSKLIQVESLEGTETTEEVANMHEKCARTNENVRRSSRRATSQKAIKQEVQMESNVRGLKRLSSTPSATEQVDEIPPKLQRQNTNNLSSILESSVQDASLLDESVVSPSFERTAMNESFASDVSHVSKRRRGRLDSLASTSASPRRSSRQSYKPNSTSETTHILFSGYNNPRHEFLVKQLGGTVVDTHESAQVLVTDKIRRTVKLLCMVGKGQPVVGPQWLALSEDAGQLLNPWEHILSDKEAEQKYHMKLETSIRKAKTQGILQHYHIFVTKNVKPEREDMKAIVLSCGGHFLTRAPSKWPTNSIVVSCQQDEAIWSKMKGTMIIVSAEWILSGVLRQELDMEAYVLKK